MRIAYLLIFMLALMSGSCDKDQTNLSSECLQVRYVGTGCLDVLQILSPLNVDSTESWSYDGILTYENCVAVKQLQDQYKDGQAFYITIKSFDVVQLVTTECTVPKYAITFDVCKDTEAAH
ncbi:MAG: hypothetical protein J7497_11120 [Chitinophagaceae bacterium]|nr:hypothetical protein [Chitinophagaceae bacterium]